MLAAPNSLPFSGAILDAVPVAVLGAIGSAVSRLKAGPIVQALVLGALGAGAGVSLNASGALTLTAAASLCLHCERQEKRCDAYNTDGFDCFHFILG